MLCFLKKASKRSMLLQPLLRVFPASLWIKSFVFPQQVRYLKIIEKSGYQALPWVRYITQNGGRSRVQQWSAHMCSYVLGNSWAIQRNTVGTNLTLMHFCENGIREAMWQRPAKCGKVNFLQQKTRMITFPDHHTGITEIAHMGLFFSLSLLLIAKHPPLISFEFHSLWVEGISCFLSPLFSLSIWLSSVHFLLRLSVTDPVGGASAGSSQVENRGGGGSPKPLTCYQWQVSVMWPGLSVSCFLFFSFVDAFLISDQCKY